MRTGTVFSVERVFDLKGWTGLLVVGVVRAGVVKAGAVLRDRETARTVRVTGIGFHSGRRESEAVTLIVDRRDAGAVREGSELVADRTDSPAG
ncbi:hypothetical protein [Streptomyces sp. NPDC059708]|uniref:hypothetical protein n=1 Tax=Streptomyces sp. NPDC059708 TaxID=3346916 RepID=UPI0036963059